MNIEIIEERIKEYRLEQAVLREVHDQMLAANQAAQQAFQEKVVANQNRFQQITGVLKELEYLKAEFVGDRNGEVLDIRK